MKVLTYFAFTLLSIVVNFALMDFIQEKIIFGNHSEPDVNSSTIKTHFDDVFKHYNKKPHALYYRTHLNLEKNIPSTKRYSNLSIESLETSTDISSTMIDLFYEENSSITDDYTTATESLTTTEYDNVTEITLFGTNNATTVKPPTKPKKTISKDCSCNLLYQVCDINCCCDSDCTDDERKMFNCKDGASEKQQNADGCISHLSFSSYLMGTGLESLFCIVKSNIPERRKLINLEDKDSTIARSYRWHSKYSKAAPIQEFSRKVYEAGDPVWILKNGSFYYIDLPAKNFNSYCSTRKILKFMHNERVTCNVKLTDLEIFHTLNVLDDFSIVSFTNTSANSSALNCSTLHCTTWKIIICDDFNCINYNKSLHEPLCTESACTNIARRLDYTFHYHESKITNATIKLFTQKLFLNVPFIEQEVNVKFVLTNVSRDKIIEYSGNPGYNFGLPVIISYKKNNYSENFYNITSKVDKYVLHPENKHGTCSLSNNTNKYVLFGENWKTKCRYFLKQSKYTNETELCKNIQKSLVEVLGLDKNIVVSPLGNPQNVKDEEWLPLKVEEIEDPLYGFYVKQNTVQCYNIVVGASYIFAYADASEVDTKRDNKILSAHVRKIARNVTFNLEDLSTVISVDIMFVDVTKPSAYEYAAGPQLNIHLPKDFFYPFLSNTANVFKFNLSTVLLSFVIFSNK